MTASAKGVQRVQRRAGRRSALAAFAGAVAVLAATALLPGAAGAAGGGVPGVSIPPTTKSGPCIRDKAAPDTVKNGVSWGQRALQFTDAWQFTQGAGIAVAVIDTGVNPGPEFGSRLRGLGDAVLGTDTDAPQPGLDDCDGHGTLVAGIIGASPDPVSGFTGVAPQATLLSIRQSSEIYQVKNSQGDNQGAGTQSTLAAAIRYAADRGARVINISEADCGAAGNITSAALSSAVDYAITRKDVVIVAAAGNVDDGTCKPQNTPGHDVTAATPAVLPGVLAVAAIGADGAPAPFSLSGAWVGVAAPGTAIVSTNPFPGGTGQVDQVTTQNASGSIQGTSFAAPYVAGVAALVRAQYPRLTAAQVIARIEQTADHPAAPGGRNEAVGYGTVNPVAALSAVLPQSAGVTAPAPRASALAPARVRVASGHPRRVALAGTLGAGAVIVALAVAVQTNRARLRRQRRLG